MPRIKSDKRNAWIKASTWYGKAVSADRTREARRNTTAPKARSPTADAKAIAYAEWLCLRDGVSIEALTRDAVEAVNASIPVAMRKRGGRSWDENARLRLKDSTTATPKVLWEPTQHGYRPRKVIWQAFLGSHPYSVIFELELPHWSYEAPEVIEWAEDDEALSLAA